LLLVVDNFEHVADAALNLVAILKGAPRVKMLVTSRAALGVLPEQQYLVRRLALPTHQVETPPAAADSGSRRSHSWRCAREPSLDWRITPAGAPIVAAVQGSWAARHARWNSPLAG